MQKKHINPKKTADDCGLSLVELLITLLLLSVVLAVGYMFYSFGTRSYNIGEAQSNVQQNVRVASDYITRELRYAFEVQILDESLTIPASVYDDFNYIFINGDDAIEHRSKEGSNVLFGGNSSGATTDSLEFNIGASSDGMLNYSISASSVNGGQTYSLSSEILIDNLNLSDTMIKNIAATTGSAIRYIKDPEAPPSMLALPVIVEAQTTFPAGFYFTLVLSFAKFETTIYYDQFILGDIFADSGISIESVDRIDASTARLYVSGTIGSEAGMGTIQVISDALTLDDNLTANVIVIENTAPTP